MEQAGRDGAMGILLVEDSPGDVRLVKEVFATTHFDVTVHVVTKGEAALHYLKEKK